MRIIEVYYLPAFFIHLSESRVSSLLLDPIRGGLRGFGNLILLFVELLVRGPDRALPLARLILNKLLFKNQGVLFRADRRDLCGRGRWLVRWGQVRCVV